MCHDFWKISFACERGKPKPEDTIASDFNTDPEYDAGAYSLWNSARYDSSDVFGTSPCLSVASDLDPYASDESLSSYGNDPWGWNYGSSRDLVLDSSSKHHRDCANNSISSDPWWDSGWCSSNKLFESDYEHRRYASTNSKDRAVKSYKDWA